MKQISRFSRSALTGTAIFGVLILASSPAAASTICTTWTSATPGTPGSASGSLNSVTVSYSGEVILAGGGTEGLNVSGGSLDWSDPASSFIGGTSTTSPSTVGDIITLQGATGINTLTFSSPIVDPLFAIWSLGQPGTPATFTFAETPTFEAGGPDEFGGAAITVAGDVVTGMEGSGVVQFTGTFSSISWTDTPEVFYGFTVGEAGAISTAPEPAAFTLLGAGLAGLGVMRHRSAR